MQPVVTTLLFDLIGIVLVVVLFKYLRSDATAEGSAHGLGKWKAGGALAGFLILMVVQIYMISYFTPKGEEALPSYHTIMDFYDDLEQGKYDKTCYDKAWKLLSPELQQNPKLWRGKIDRFVAGYKNTERIKLRAVRLLSSTASQYSHDYIAYYEDETNSPLLPGLVGLGDKNVGNLPAINEKVLRLRNTLQENGLDVTVLDKMKLHELMSANRGDILRWRLEEKSGAKVDTVFPTSSTVTRLVGKTITVGLHGKKWLIDKIDPIPYNMEGEELPASD